MVVSPRGRAATRSLFAARRRNYRAWLLAASEYRASIGAVLAVCLLLSISLAASWQSPGFGVDEGLLLEYPTLIQHGEVPFRDFQSSYGPGTYLPLVAAYAVFGPSATVERAVGVAYRVLVILAIVSLMFPLGAAVTATGGALAVLGISGPGPPSAYGWYGAAACALWAVWLARRALQTQTRRAGWRWAGSGLLVGCATSIRPELGLVAALALVILVAGGNRSGRILFASGFGVGLFPLGFNVVVAGLSAIWTNWVQARFHVQPQSRFPLSPSALALLSIAVLVAAFLLVTAVRELRRDGPTPIARGWLVLSIIGLGLLPQVFQRTDEAHFADVAPLVLGMLPWAISYGGKRTWVTTTAIAGAAALAVGLHAVVNIQNGSGYEVSHDGRTFAVPTRYEQVKMQAVLGYVDLHTSPGQRIFVGPRDLRWAGSDDTWIYYLLPKLRPASFYLDLAPGDPNRAGSRLPRDLKRADILILESISSTTRRQFFPYARAGPVASNEIVARDFYAGFRAGPYSVWLTRRVVIATTRGRAPVGGVLRSTARRTVASDDPANETDRELGLDQGLAVGRPL